jgi:phosphatidylserine/phosphatidylglycerophosphate/cardiolipin synthase-like enzyme
MIGKAKVSIYASHFSFLTQEPLCQKILAALIDAKKRGVAITILLEGKKKGVKEKNLNTQKKLKESGIKVYLSVSRRVAHAKVFVIDGEWVLAGSTNLSYSSMTHNHESNLLVKSGEIAQTLEKYIQELIADSDREIKLESKIDNQIQVVTDQNFIPHALELIRKATEEICITTYLFDYPADEPQSNIAKLFQELIKAKERGVRIRIFLERSSFQFNEHISKKNLETAKFLSTQKIDGIQFDLPNQVTHCKIILVDKKKALLGSTNWYLYDLDFAHQVNFIIEEKTIIQALTTYFDQLYSEKH